MAKKKVEVVDNSSKPVKPVRTPVTEEQLENELRVHFRMRGNAKEQANRLGYMIFRFTKPEYQKWALDLVKIYKYASSPEKRKKAKRIITRALVDGFLEAAENALRGGYEPPVKRRKKK